MDIEEGMRENRPGSWLCCDEHEDDRQREEALLEYVGFLDAREREKMALRLANDAPFHASMVNVISDMSMLIAGAAVIDEDHDFRALLNDLLFNAVGDDPDMRLMRLFYLENGGELNMEMLLESEKERARYLERLEAFRSCYLDMHPS